VNAFSGQAPHVLQWFCRATLTCKKSASKEGEDLMDMMDPMDAPTVAYCFTVSAAQHQYPLQPPGDSVNLPKLLWQPADGICSST